MPEGRKGVGKTHVSRDHSGDAGNEQAIGNEPTDMASVRLPMRGAVVDGRYNVIESIGDGGFGWVFKVEHKLLGRVFAMKILHPRIADDPSWIKRFAEEAKATSLIGHENIVFVTDFGQCQQYGYYFTMEYLDGVTLSDLIAHYEYMALEDTMKFAIAAGSALSAVHDLGIVHCDLKPGNVMVLDRPRREPVWKFLDFGTSTFVIDAADSDYVYGTPAYMAPEQAIGREVDAKADQFSLGCIIYEMLTGKIPYQTLVWEDAFPENRKKYPPKPIHEVRDDVPPELFDVISRAIDLRRAYRWPSVEAFVEAMQGVVSLDEFKATEDPLDLKVSSDDQTFARSLTAPRVTMPALAEASVVVDIDDSDAVDELTSITLNFRSAARLRREWRRNLIGGSIFVPTPNVLDLGTPIEITLLYQDEFHAFTFRGVVTSHSHSEDGKEKVGFGMGIRPEGLRELKQFLRGLQLGLGLSQDDVLSAARGMREEDRLTAGEAYLLSRLESPTPVGRARAAVSGLPFEFEDAVANLVDKGLLAVEQGGHMSEAEIVRSEAVAVTPNIVAVKFNLEERQRAMELVEFHMHRANYLAALSVLRRAIAFASDEPEFHFLYGKIQAEFNDDRSTAMRAVDTAIRLRPNETRYTEFKENL